MTSQNARHCIKPETRPFICVYKPRAVFIIVHTSRMHTDKAVRFVSEFDEVKMEDAILPTRIRKRPKGRTAMQVLAVGLLLLLLCVLTLCGVIIRQQGKTMYPMNPHAWNCVQLSTSDCKPECFSRHANTNQMRLHCQQLNVNISLTFLYFRGPQLSWQF